MSKISISKPRMRWLFGGIGFHNSEATMTALMSDKLLNEKAVKVFNEISPTFSRVFGGYADWTREAMDAFADYYDRTFRKAGTLLYLVPGRMPMIMDDFDLEDYCERVAANLDYLINEKGCVKIRYYCVTNELSCGNTYAYFSKHLDVFKKLHEGLYKAFHRHGLDVGLLATDCSGVRNFDQIRWAADNMDEISEAYCAHLYNYDYDVEDAEAYDYYLNSFAAPINEARRKEKRFIMGEFGISYGDKWENGLPMGNDCSYAVGFPEKDGIYAVAIAEMALAIINSGCLHGAFWTMLDYPDPFLREMGETTEEKAVYDCARFSGHGISYRYNKNGLVKWCDDECDYSSRAALYTMGYIAKLFRKGSRVLKTECADALIRCAAVTNSDGSVAIAAINRKNEADNIEISLEHKCDKPLRKYVFEADNIPYNDFCDLQGHTELVCADESIIKTELPPRSVVFLTTDYKDRIPSEISGIKISEGKLCWSPCKDEEHCYYRVFASDDPKFIPSIENQIASTSAEYTEITDPKLFYKVLSVDKWGNTR